MKLSWTAVIKFTMVNSRIKLSKIKKDIKSEDFKQDRWPINNLYQEQHDISYIHKMNEQELFHLQQFYKQRRQKMQNFTNKNNVHRLQTVDKQGEKIREQNYEPNL